MTSLIIFDLDDTLCRHSEAHQRAQNRINLILRNSGIPETVFWEHFERIEPALLRSVAQGFLGGIEYQWRRFADVCSRICHAVGVLPDVIGQIYYEETVRRVKMFDDSLPVLAELKERGLRLAILTNGDTFSQREKFKRLALSEFVNSHHFFVSEEIGFSKPDEEIFRTVLKEMRCAPEDAIMVGDSLVRDVHGAMSVGIRPLFLDRQDSHSRVYPGERLESLFEIFAHINGDFEAETKKEQESVQNSREKLYQNFVL